MALPLPGMAPDDDAPVGHTYGAVLVPAAVTREAVIEALRAIRFTGWVGVPEGDWIAAVARPGDGVVADGRRGVVEAAAAVAGRLDTTAFALRVRIDRQLVIVAWRAGEDLGRYSSDPSREPGADEEVLSEPYGAEHAEAFADAAGRPDAGPELAEVLDEELESDSVSESERLARVLGLLGMPRWIVASESLPRDVPTGPRAGDLVRLGAGSPGAAGRITGWAADLRRRRMTPPQALADPPRGANPGLEPWMF